MNQLPASEPITRDSRNAKGSSAGYAGYAVTLCRLYRLCRLCRPRGGRTFGAEDERGLALSRECASTDRRSQPQVDRGRLSTWERSIPLRTNTPCSQTGLLPFSALFFSLHRAFTLECSSAPQRALGAIADRVF